MSINKYNKHIIVVCILVSLIFSSEGLCQSYSIIDIDKARVLELPEKQKEEPNIDEMLRFNNIIRIKDKSVTPYVVDYIPVYEPPIISKGNVFINLDNNKTVFNLETVTEITNVNKLCYFQYAVNEISIKEYIKNDLYKSMFGEYPSKTEYYLTSVDQVTGDTLWKKKGRYLAVCQANTVIFIKNDSGESFIIDNKSGKDLFKLSSSKPINITEAKEENGYLYLKTNGSTEGELIAINLQKSEVTWIIKGNIKSFFLDETRIYTSNQYAIDKMTGRLIWSNSSNIRIVGIVGNYLIGYLYLGEDDPEIFVYDKNTGKLAGYLWSDNEFCTSCFGYQSCNPEFVFAEQGEGNKTAALIKCNDEVYLYTFEAVDN